MQEFPISPKEMFSSLWRNWGLIKELTKREILSRYRGSVMGLLWPFLTPVLTLMVYTFIFSEVFKTRWGTGSESKTEFALVLFAGLIIFNLFAECITRAPGLILSNINYVKKVVFPLEILPFVGILSALFHSAINLCVWLLAYLILFSLPHASVFYLPLIMLPFILFILGLSWALASLGVYLRDISQFIGIVITISMFMSPLFYPISSVPETYRDLLYLNPLTPAIEQARVVLYFGESPDFVLLTIYLVATIIVAWLGFIWFQKTRKGFADVI